MCKNLLVNKYAGKYDLLYKRILWDQITTVKFIII